MTGRLRLVAAGVAMTLLLTPPAAAQVEASCELGEELLAAGLLSQARQVFEALLDAEQPDPCATDGLVRTADLESEAAAHVARGRVFEAGDDPASAKEEYLAALAVDITDSEAAAALEALVSPEDEPDSSPYAKALILLDAGYVDEARKAAQEAATAGNPVPERLENERAWHEQVLGRSADFVAFVTGVAAALAIVVVLVALAVLLLGRIRRLHRIWPWRGYLSPQVVIAEDFGDPTKDMSIGKVLASMISYELQAAEPDEGSSLSQVTSVEESAGLADRIEIGEELKFVGRIVNALGRRPRLTVSGRAQHPGRTRVAVTVQISNEKGQVLHSRLFSGKAVKTKVKDDEILDVESYYRLMPEAGAWVVFMLHRALNDDQLRLLGTREWRSYAAFRRGLYLERSDPAAARRSYLDAIEEDSGNVAALVNLGSLDFRVSEGFARAVARLRLAMERMEANGQGSHTNSRMWYAAAYTRAASARHRALEIQGDPDLAEEADAMASDSAMTAQRLVGTMARRLNELSAKQDLDKADRFLYDMLTTYELSSVVLLADSAAAAKAAGLLTFNNDTAPANASPRERREWFGRVDTTLMTAPSDEEMIKLVVGSDVLSVRAAYNLACYFSEKSDFPAAIKWLTQGLERTSFAEWAGKDPTLRNLRESAVYGPQFADLISKATAAAKPKPKEPTGTWRITRVA